jgi:hypothetical protein
VSADSDTMKNLAAALRDYGDALVPLSVQSYTAVTFRLSATVKVSTDADEDTVLTAAEHALAEHFAFASRDFGQTVSIDEVMSVIHGVTGVDGVDVNELYRLDPGATPGITARLFAFPAQIQSDGTVKPAELLTLGQSSLSLGVML